MFAVSIKLEEILIKHVNLTWLLFPSTVEMLPHYVD